MSQTLYTPRAEKVLELAAEEAAQLNHSYVGTEHILLGLLRNGQGIAVNSLQEMGVTIEKAYEKILEQMSPAEPPSARYLQARINALEAQVKLLTATKEVA